MIPNLKFSEMGEGVFRSKLWSGKFGPKFTVRPETCLCITVVSHTYVETNKQTKQECIPAGCVPPTSMVISRGGAAQCGDFQGVSAQGVCVQGVSP